MQEIRRKQDCDVPRALYLISEGAPPDTQSSEDGETVLTLACEYGLIDVVKALLDKGANIEKGGKGDLPPLMNAVFGGHENVARLLLDRHANINQSYGTGMVALAFAAYHGNAAMVRFLVENGADIFKKDNNGRMAFDRAVERNHADVALFLKDAEVRARMPREEWLLASPVSVAHAAPMPGVLHSMTDIFNFAMRERIVIMKNEKSGAESIAAPVSFDAVNRPVLEKALAEFTRLGGVVDPAFVLRRKLVKPLGDF